MTTDMSPHRAANAAESIDEMAARSKKRLLGMLDYWTHVVENNPGSHASQDLRRFADIWDDEITTLVGDTQRFAHRVHTAAWQTNATESECRDIAEGMLKDLSQ